MKVTQLCLLLSFIAVSQSFEPITSIAVGAAAYGGFHFFDDIKKLTYCRWKECCNSDMIPFNIMSLREKIIDNLYGQHIVEEKVFQAVASHYKEIEKSQKPLVMSFHGLQGTGKNYVSNMIAESVFKLGTKSKFYHIFHGSQYGDSDRIQEYKRNIEKSVSDGIDACEFSIFVFDEVDKMPKGIFDSIRAMLDHHTLVKGKDFKKAVFIFLSNFGGEEIAKVLFQLTTNKGLYRHETKLSHFEDIVKFGVYNREGGLQESALIKSAVIDFYIPFLPLEEKHIVQCIKSEYQTFGRSYITEDMVNEILNYIGFNSVTKYAHTGCKTIHPKVRAECL